MHVAPILLTVEIAFYLYKRTLEAWGGDRPCNKAYGGPVQQTLVTASSRDEPSPSQYGRHVACMHSALKTA